MEKLPLELENIILDYKAQLEHTGIFKDTMKKICNLVYHMEYNIDHEMYITNIYPSPDGPNYYKHGAFVRILFHTCVYCNNYTNTDYLYGTTIVTDTNIDLCNCFE